MDIHQITPDPEQPRGEFDADSLLALAHNLREKGQLHPIHVRWSAELQLWVIVSGERRWRAARLANLAEVNCYCHEQTLSRSEILELQLIENLLREDLKPVAEAQGFASLMQLNGWNGKQVATALRIPPSKVTRALALLKLPADIQQQVEQGAVSARTAYEISKIADETQRRQLALQAATGELSHQAAADIAQPKRRAAISKSHVARQTFVTEVGWTIVATGPHSTTYEALETALLQVLDEVRLRIDNGVRL
jgi:ParB family chromosome partitioning protein